MRWIVLGCAVVLALVGGFVAGFAVGKINPENARGYVPPGAYVAPANYTFYKYPGSAEHGSGKSGSTTSNGVVIAGNRELVATTTTDSFEKVLDHYASLFSNPIIGAGSSGSSGRSMGGPTGTYVESTIAVEDETAAGEQQKRPVRAKVVLIRNNALDVVIHVSRAKDEAHTHVVIAYMPRP